MIVIALAPVLQARQLFRLQPILERLLHRCGTALAALAVAAAQVASWMACPARLTLTNCTGAENCPPGPAKRFSPPVVDVVLVKIEYLNLNVTSLLS